MKLLKHRILGQIMNYLGGIAVWKINYPPASLGIQGSTDPHLFQLLILARFPTVGKGKFQSLFGMMPSPKITYILIFICAGCW